MGETDEFITWINQCIDESRAQKDEEYLLQEEWEKMNQEKVR